MNTLLFVFPDICTYVHTHARTRAHTHARTRAHTHTYTHTSKKNQKIK